MFRWKIIIEKWISFCCTWIAFEPFTIFARDIVAYLANSWLTEIDSKTETEQDIDVYLNETRTFNGIFDRFFNFDVFLFIISGKLMNFSTTKDSIAVWLDYTSCLGCWICIPSIFLLCFSISLFYFSLSRTFFFPPFSVLLFYPILFRLLCFRFSCVAFHSFVVLHSYYSLLFGWRTHFLCCLMQKFNSTKPEKDKNSNKYDSLNDLRKSVDYKTRNVCLSTFIKRTVTIRQRKVFYQTLFHLNPFKFLNAWNQRKKKSNNNSR